MVLHRASNGELLAIYWRMDQPPVRSHMRNNDAVQRYDGAWY